MKALSVFLNLLLCSLIVASETPNENNEVEPENGLATICRPLDKALDLLFILDGSGSVSGGTWTIQLNMVKKILNQVEVGLNKTRIAVLQYSSWTKTEFNFTKYTTLKSVKAALDRIRFLSGTTRTGKALHKAHEAFNEIMGARINRKDVAKVIVLVSDGYSQDDPVVWADKLRERGVEILALGMGSYVNLDGLLDITHSYERTFLNNSVDAFVKTFRTIAVGEECKFAKEPNGAEVLCQDDRIVVNILTTKPFRGHLYVKDHFREAGCSTHNGNNRTDVSLSIPLMHCGVREQFMFNPRGMLFETTVILKFNPDIQTSLDKKFKVRCFYGEHLKMTENELQVDAITNGTGAENITTIRPSLDLEAYYVQMYGHPSTFPAWTMHMPCAYTIRQGSPEGCITKHADIGEKLFHTWECDSGLIGQEMNMLVHSCYMSNGRSKRLPIIDPRGCPVDKKIVKLTEYAGKLFAYAQATVGAFTDENNVQFHCQLRFCNSSKFECDGILPLNCDVEPHRTSASNDDYSNYNKDLTKAADFDPTIGSTGLREPWKFAARIKRQSTNFPSFIDFQPIRVNVPNSPTNLKTIRGPFIVQPQTPVPPLIIDPVNSSKDFINAMPGMDKIMQAMKTERIGEPISRSKPIVLSESERTPENKLFSEFITLPQWKPTTTIKSPITTTVTTNKPFMDKMPGMDAIMNVMHGLQSQRQFTESTKESKEMTILKEMDMEGSGEGQRIPDMNEMTTISTTSTMAPTTPNPRSMKPEGLSEFLLPEYDFDNLSIFSNSIMVSEPEVVNKESSTVGFGPTLQYCDGRSTNEPLIFRKRT